MQRKLLKLSMALFAIQFGNAFAGINSQSESVDKFMQQFIQSYEHKDISGIARLYSKNAIVIGTGSDETLVGRDQIVRDYKRDFSQSESAKISFERIGVDIKNNIAVASYYLNVDVKTSKNNTFASKLRFSATLEKQNNHWVILQSHLSSPLQDQQPGNSFPENANT